MSLDSRPEVGPVSKVYNPGSRDSRPVAVHGRCRDACAEGEPADGERVKLMRLRYGGTASRWGFALYYAGSDRYEDSLLPAGAFAGGPEDTLDCACQLHLAGPGL
ncbi:hypothetical protein OG413_28605 [Streptomyces sp. NBC_01433]|uniref:hypothetical protein n=1 Tax=Streptomyces sp. NBC_01433 TaxID=2903864 RepID=UPI002257ED6D|nr:hypothetical protein [Streptomyces sp. NBC_01433]MCX4679214.1 hypothetical protein [Streptomyces sp. NBC_01433]